MPSFDPAAVKRFRYDGYELDAAGGVLRCRYLLDDLAFTEEVGFGPVAPGVDPVALDAAARLVHLLAGVSYYKAAAPPRIEVDAPGLTPATRRLLTAFFLDGLGEYAYRNGLDLSGLEIVADDAPPSAPAPRDAPRRPLIPFGGGVDSIVTVEGVRDRAPDAALFVVSRGGDRFDAIEEAAAVTGLPVVRAERTIDAQLLRKDTGFRNGHVPVTGILSAIAVLCAVADRRDAVVMSNEWSASSGNVERDGRVVNHQWSKSLAFEDLFRAALAEMLPSPPEYYSWLRPFSELWVAERFSALDRYHHAFRSCNRSFHLDRALRLDHWCGRCDKCCFIDLILAPYLSPAELGRIFDGAEPLRNPELVEQFRTLVGTSGDIKPFECVGDVDECRVAALVAADRDDRADASTDAVLAGLAAELRPLVGDDVERFATRLRRPLGPHRIPDAHAPSVLLG